MEIDPHLLEQITKRGRLSDKETDDLKAHFAAKKEERRPFYLTIDAFEAVTRWKLKRQHGRQRHNLIKNTAGVIEPLTRAAFALRHDDPKLETRFKLDLLCILHGVHVPVASAFLALVEQEDYGVLDFRVWQILFGENRRSFGHGNYQWYLDTIRPVARKLSWQTQEMDLALWQLSFKI